MTNRPTRRLRLWWLPLVVLATLHGQDKPLEPSAPGATTAVQQLLDQAAAAASAGDAANALALADRALAVAQPVADVAGQALAQRVRALQLAKLNRKDDEQAAWHEAEMAWARLGDGPGQVEALGWQGVLLLPGNAPQGTELLQHALTLARAETKRPRATTSALVDVGHALYNGSLLREARQTLEAAVTIAEEVGPTSIELASSLNGLGTVTFSQGDLSAAGDYTQRALAIRETLAPNSLAVATSLNNLGNVALRRGDSSAALDFQQRSLAIREKLAPNSLDVAYSLNNLGLVAAVQGDLSAARDFHQRALAIKEKLAPNSVDVATSLGNLGFVAVEQGDLTAARGFCQRALAIEEELAPNSLDAAYSLNDLGRVAADQGDLSAARAFHERALAIRERLAPNSVDVAISLLNLGNLASAQGDLGVARTFYERSLAIQEKLAPNSVDPLAWILRELGQNAFDRGDRVSATQLTTRAWAIVRAHAVAVAGDDARQAFASAYEPIASQLVGFQIALGQSDQAFVTVEEGRAQALLQLLAERGIARRLAPADVWQRYELAQTASDQAGKALESAGAAEANAKAGLDAEVAQQSAAAVIQEKRTRLTEMEHATEQARESTVAPRVEAERRWADVRHAIEAAVPAPIGVADARLALPSDAVLAAFVVGDEASTLFLARRDGPVQAFPIALPSKELAAKVNYVRRSVSGEADERGVKLVASDELRVEAARTLYQKLFPPDARQAIGQATRILLSPDGVLWDLPFAALVINDQGKPQYLGLEKPLVYTQSLTTFAQTLRAPVPQHAGAPNVLVVGNPLFDNALRNVSSSTSGGKGTGSSEPTSSSTTQARGERALLSRDGDVPVPLPYAEAEAEQVAALYHVRAATGSEPTEAWFRQHAVNADIIHLATHGYFNPFRAASSGVLLAVPEQEPAPGETDNDGALQAWEIFSLQLRADLVVLSACQTGLGAKVPGEGLVGLTRAFQVAGAASIVATQWSVADKSTAAGMVAFHQKLLQGLPKDEALRQAMRTLAADPTSSDPHYWAPFVLVGDFRPLRTFPAR